MFKVFTLQGYLGNRVACLRRLHYRGTWAASWDFLRCLQPAGIA